MTKVRSTGDSYGILGSKQRAVYGDAVVTKTVFPATLGSGTPTCISQRLEKSTKNEHQNHR